MNNPALSANNLVCMNMIVSKNPNNIRKIVYMGRQMGKTTIAIRIAQKLGWPIIVSNRNMADCIHSRDPEINVKTLASEFSLRGIHKAIIDDIDMLEPRCAKPLCLDEFICFTSLLDNKQIVPSMEGRDYMAMSQHHILHQYGFLIREIPGKGPTYIFLNLYPEKVYDQFKITVSKDGDQWCALIGEDIQEGYSGFGYTVAEALADLMVNVDKEIIKMNHGEGVNPLLEHILVYMKDNILETIKKDRKKKR